MSITLVTAGKAGAAVAATAVLLATAGSALAHGAASGSATTRAAVPTVLRFRVPVAEVRAHSTDNPPHDVSAGDTFQESYKPRAKSALRHQDSIATATFGGRATFLGTVNLTGGQIVYAGTTTNQDDNVYSILGGTGRYRSAAGTLALHPASRRVETVTITLEAIS